MSWYVLQCKTGQEQAIIRSCEQHLSGQALESAFSFRCERLWKTDGAWKIVEKDMFPGYVFLQSGNPELLSKELDEYRKILKVMEEEGYLISVYGEEEQYLRDLCGESHFLKLSHGYKENGVDIITDGPLKGRENRILRIDWHRRFAQIVIPVAKKKAVIWAGLELDSSVAGEKNAVLVS